MKECVMLRDAIHSLSCVLKYGELGVVLHTNIY